VAAHECGVRTLVLVQDEVWSSANDLTIHVWDARALPPRRKCKLKCPKASATTLT
jgi:hypothetical protein